MWYFIHDNQNKETMSWNKTLLLDNDLSVASESDKWLPYIALGTALILIPFYTEWHRMYDIAFYVILSFAIYLWPDVESEKKKAEWREIARRELEEWYKHRNEQVDKAQKVNR